MTWNRRLAWGMVAVTLGMLGASLTEASLHPWWDWTDCLLAALLVAGMNAVRAEPANGHADDNRRSRRFDGGTLYSDSGLSGVLCACFFLPLMLEPIKRWCDYGVPLEVLLTCGLRNVMVGLIVSRRTSHQNVALAASLFLVLYAILVSHSAFLFCLLVAYAGLGIGWLMVSYWGELSEQCTEVHATSSVLVPRALVLAALAIAVVASWGISGSVTSAIALSGFLPSSGGSQGNDPFARRGVGDGENLVEARDNAQSFGPIESEVFIESQQPSLYDMFSESYGEPRKRQQVNRAIPLNQQDTVRESHEEKSEAQKASREFSMSRRTLRQPSKKPATTNSTAIAYIQGRVPIHLKVAHFNHWDGHSLLYLPQPDARPMPELELISDGTDDWAEHAWVADPQLFVDVERHVVKIVNWREPMIPSPPNLRGVRIDRMHTASLFRWTEDQIVQLQGDRIPSLTVLHVKSLRIEPDQLPRVKLARLASHGSESIDSAAISDWARRETAGAVSDWEHVVRLCDSLTQNFQLTPRTGNSLADPNWDDKRQTNPIEDFLTVHHAGPDHVFATTAALALRSLGYSTRVVAGLYARPDRYDRAARATAVLSEDTHFWLEVETVDGAWIPVDPSPGYQMLYAELGPLQQLWQTIRSIGYRWRWLMGLVVALLAGMLLIWRYRAFVVWQMVNGNVAWLAPRQTRRCVRWSLSIIAWVAHARRQRRWPSQTLDQWLVQVYPERSSDVLREYRELVSWASYADELPMPPLSLPVQEVCCRAMRLLIGKLVQHASRI